VCDAEQYKRPCDSPSCFGRPGVTTFLLKEILLFCYISVVNVPPAVAAYPIFLVVVVVVYQASPLVISFQCFELRWLRGQKAAAAAKRDKQ
jgi:hypothetical protein